MISIDIKENNKINSFQNRKENFNQTIIPKLLFLEKNSFEQEETFDYFVEKPNYNFSHFFNRLVNRFFWQNTCWSLAVYTGFSLVAKV